MANPFTPSTFRKFLARTAAVLAGVTFVFWFTVNLWVERKLPFIETTISAAAHRPITLEHAHYHIFKGFLLDGLEVRQNKEGALPVRVKRVRIEPMFQLLPEPGIRIRKIVFEKPDIALRLKPEDPFSLGLILNHLAPELGAIGSLKILMRLSAVEVIDARVRLVSSSGGTDVKRDLSGLNFSAKWKKKGTRFTGVTFRSGPLLMTGQGESSLSKTAGHYRFLLSSKKMPLERLGDALSPVVPDAGFIQFIVTLDGDLTHFEPALQAMFYDCSFHDPLRKISVTNMDGLVRLSKYGLELKRCWLELNHLPLFLHGRWQMTDDARILLKIGVNPGQPSAGGLAKASLKAAVVRSKEGWSGGIRLARGTDRWTLSFHGLSRDGQGSWVCQNLQVRHQDRASQESTRVYSLRGLIMDLSASQKYLRAKVLKAVWSGADLRANLWLRMADLAWSASAYFENADVSKVLAYTKNTYPISGRISTDLTWKGVGGAIQCLVHFKISEGMIGPSSQLTYWAKQTGLEALSVVRFHSFSGGASYENGSWSLKHFRLTGDALLMTANLKVSAERVWGALSAKIPSAAIAESSDLKWLLRFVKAGDWVDFDFKVAGHPSSPRVQWLSGEFKKKVESRLAPWMKNELTRQVEKRLGDGSTGPV